MTTNEIIERLRIIDVYLDEDIEVIESAISALSAQTDGDVISRQAAIDAVLNLDVSKRVSWMDAVIDEIDALPSAQPKSANEPTKTVHIVPNEDFISRKTAIDALDGAKVDEENCTEYDIGYNDGIDFVISRLSVLPSAQPEPSQIARDIATIIGNEQDMRVIAQPEIIRCRDCKKCQIDSVFHDYWCDGRKVRENHYCGYAERRTDERMDV